ncbi:MAG: hypothetical protein NT013_18170 [Planctomycetia bacterium]|nr:hypothetical protein [Planctomycetia bacterium]
MRSVPLALTWEMLSKGFWTLIGFSFAANGLPVLLLSAMRVDGVIDANEPVWIIMHLTMSQISMIVFGIGVLSAQGNPSRLFAMPISNSAIATWHQVLAMALVGLHSAVSSAALNALFDLNWPVWGPAMFMAVAVAGFQATCWFTEKTGWIIWGLVLYGAVFGLWFKSRYGGTFSPATQHWSVVTAGDVATMLAFFLVSHFIALNGIARNRRGDALPSLGIIAWIERLLDPAPDFGLPFRTPSESHFWLEWRKKGVVMPVGVVMCMTIGLSGWLMACREPQDLFDGFLSGGWTLSVLGLVGGLAMGCFGAISANFGISYDMGSFFATRPMTSSDFARSILKTAAKSVLITWLIWAVATIAIYLLSLAMSSVPLRWPPKLGWWYFPVTLLGSWLVVATGTSIGLTGRAELFVKLFCGFAVLLVGLPIVSRSTLPPRVVTQLTHGLAATVGLAFVLGTAWAFAVARRRSLIGNPTILMAASIWFGVVAFVFAEVLRHHDQELHRIMFLTGLLTLAVAPLAVAWNRNR